MRGREQGFSKPMFRAASRVFAPIIEDLGLAFVRRSIEVEVSGHLIRAALVATPSREAQGRRGAESFFAYAQKKEVELAKQYPAGIPEIQYRKHLARWVDEYNAYVGGDRK